MKLSVIVAAFNCESTLVPCLEAIRRNSGQDYELILVDDGSSDRTAEIGRRFADIFIRHPENLGRQRARLSGFNRARGEILVNVDSDVVIPADTLEKIQVFFRGHSAYGALTATLSPKHRPATFWGRYKNLYMVDRFRSQPRDVTFLYGSLYAFRRAYVPSGPLIAEIADDTALGQQLVRQGIKIALIKEIEVIHLKEYNFPGWAKNDFQIPRDWAKIFIHHQGWRQLSKGATGFAHASRAQILSLILAVLIAGLFLLSFFKPLWGVPAFALFIVWFFLNLKFIIFLNEENGFAFAVAAIGVTFLDHLIMAAGIASGFCSVGLRGGRVVRDSFRLI